MSHIRSRWTAVGAAVAVTLGAGGLFTAQAATPSTSGYVPVVETRVLDTRPAVNIGPIGPVASDTSRKLVLTGIIATGEGDQQIIPAGATAAVYNVTVVEPTAAGFVAVRSGDATGTPLTSSINFDAGVTIANGGTVTLPTTGTNAGAIDIFYHGATPGATTDIVIDITGYYVPGSSAAGSKGDQGIQGETGSKGDQGIQGETGSKGDQGIQGETGSKGDQGIQGETGPKGDQGIQGETGPQGIQGIQGETGPQGIQGIQGETGPQGDQGIQGDTGPQGDQGIQGDTGPQGDQGIQGDTGPQGDQGIQGDTGPQGDQGVQGEPGVGDLGCSTDQTISWDDAEGSWMCANPVANTDTLASLNCTLNQTIGWNGEAWECRSAPITASLTRNAFEDPCCSIDRVFSAYSPNIDTNYGICDDFICQVRLVDVVDHTSCQVNVSDPDVDIFLLPDRIDVFHLFAAEFETLYVNISCSPSGAPAPA